MGGGREWVIERKRYRESGQKRQTYRERKTDRLTDKQRDRQRGNVFVIATAILVQVKNCISENPFGGT